VVGFHAGFAMINHVQYRVEARQFDPFVVYRMFLVVGVCPADMARMKLFLAWFGNSCLECMFARRLPANDAFNDLQNVVLKKKHTWAGLVGGMHGSVVLQDV
jgi:hypothetical protein